MSVIAKLMFLEGIKVPFPHGIVVIRAEDNPNHSTEVGNVVQGQKILLDSFPQIHELPLDDDDQLELEMFYDETFSGRQHLLGKVFIVAAEVGLGERKQQFTGDEAHYELTYKVVAA